MIVDKYFKRPIFWDYFLTTIVVGIVMLLKFKAVIKLPKEEDVYSIISDLSTVSLTMVGFILTLVTVLISFKSSSKVKKELVNEKTAVFDAFFASQLYFETIRHLKNGIKSLTLIALSGYFLKLMIGQMHYQYLFFFCFVGIIIILMTVGRSLLILSSIIKIQQS